jgi:GNAT superfamily N-acetyltransferase
MGIEVVPVMDKRAREQFLRLPWRLYGDDPAWVPNLLMLQREVIDTRKNPFFDHGEAQLFLALRDGEPAGRISAQIDRLHNEHHGERTGFFGFFESVDDGGVARALFEAADHWLRERGMNCARGPMNFSVNEEVGMLIEGFEHPPMIATTHALPYYGALVEGAGYAKAIDLFAYRWDIKEPPERMMKVVEGTRSSPHVRVRTVDMHNLQRDVDTLLDIYNEAWKDNWGYVPATRREAQKMASDLRLIADPNIGIIAEVDGEPAGMILGLPNLYEAIRDFKGSLNPWNAIRLVWRLKVRKLETGRLLLFGVKPKFRRSRDLVGLPFLLLYELYLGSKKGRYKWGEMSWVLENNGALNAIMPYWGAFVYKRYRIYEKVLEDRP